MILFFEFSNSAQATWALKSEDFQGSGQRAESAHAHRSDQGVASVVSSSPGSRSSESEFGVQSSDSAMDSEQRTANSEKKNKDAPYCLL